MNDEQMLKISKRFWSKVDIRSESDCWEYKEALGSKGYGQFYINPECRNIGAHRMAWKLYNKKEIPEKMHILHHCDNRKCCNPIHLYCGTNQDNITDKTKRFKQPGVLGRTSNLRSGEIWLIRKLQVILPTHNLQRKKYKFHPELIAKMFKVTKATIYDIWRSKEYLGKDRILI